MYLLPPGEIEIILKTSVSAVQFDIFAFRRMQNIFVLLCKS